MEPFGIKVLQDESSPPGQVVFRITGVERAPLDESFIVRRADDQSAEMGSDWPTGPRAPLSSEWHADSQVLELVVGPDVVNPIAGGTPVIIRLPGLANREAALIWPDGLLLAVAQNRRRGQSRREVAVPAVPDARSSFPLTQPSAAAVARTPVSPPIPPSPPTPTIIPPPPPPPPAAPQAAPAPAPATPAPPVAQPFAIRPPSGPPAGAPPVPQKSADEAPRPPAARVLPKPPSMGWERPQRTGPPLAGIIGAVLVLAAAGFLVYKYGFTPSSHTGPAAGPGSSSQVSPPPPQPPAPQPPAPQPPAPKIDKPGTDANESRVRRADVPEIPPTPQPAAGSPAGCSDQRSDYELAMRKYVTEKRDAARLLTCAINGSDQDLAERAKSALAELQQP